MYIHPLDAPSPTPGRSICLQGKCEARMNADVGAQGKKSLRIAEECVTIDPRSSRSQAIKHQDSSTANGLVLFFNEEEERLEFF